jgi:hypothetical protein
LVASYVVACMQPDRRRPEARMASFTLSDDIMFFR